MGRQPLGGPSQFNQGVNSLYQMMDMVQRSQALRELTAERRERLAIQERAEREREQTKAEERAKSLFTEAAEAATGAAPTSETMQWLGELRNLTRPTMPGEQRTIREELPTGGMVTRPYVTGGDIAAAARRAQMQARSATEAAGAALPPSPEAELVRGQIARGELRVPSAVGPAYEKTLEAGKKAQELGALRVGEEPKRRKEFAEASTAEATARLKDIELTYAVPKTEADLAEKKAQTERASVEARKAQREMGELPPEKGSKLDLELQTKQEELNAKRHDARKAQIEEDQQRRYLTAMDQFRRTGNLGYLHQAITFASGGAIDTAKLMQTGERIDLERDRAVASILEGSMLKRTQLQDAVNKKQLPEALNIAGTLNNESVSTSALKRSPTASWTSVRQEEGWGGAIRSTQVIIPIEDAKRLMNDAVKPNTWQNLALLMKAHYGDLVERSRAGDPVATQRLLQSAGAYPEVSQEVFDQYKAEVEKIMSGRQPQGAQGVVAPAVAAPSVRAPAPAGTTLVGPGAPVVGGDPYAATRQRFRESIGRPSGEQALGERRNDAAIARFRRPYVQLSPSERAEIDAQVR